MPPADGKALCVSIHDVAPATWADCERLLQAIRAVADVPLTLLVVPQYHGCGTLPAAYENRLGELLAQGHELALHGYTHLDTAPLRAGLRRRFMRTVYTDREGEFAALDEAEAVLRLELGQAWFRQRDWPLRGFVAPAWLLSEGAWRALRQSPFDYTTTLTRFHLLPQGQALWSPSLVYSTRNVSGRRVSPHWVGILGHFLQAAPLVRLSLHPREAHYPDLVRHAQQSLARLLLTRQPLTKAAFAQQFRRAVQP